MKALVDGDIILYRCGFAAQSRIYNLSIPLFQGEIPKFKYKKDMMDWLNEHGREKSEYDVTVDTVIEPVENALNNVKTVLTEIKSYLSKRFGEIELEIFLSGSTNFRDNLATIKIYKGNRDPLHKPHWYDEIKEYLKSVWDAQEVENLEADDILADLQESVPSSEDSCIISTDKDLDQIAGWHYNWVKDQLYEVSVEQAIHNKYVQILTGDSTDNIEGIPGVGPVGAEKCLEWCETVDDYEQSVSQEYEHFFTQTKKGVEKCNEYCMTWDEILEETRALITLGSIDNGK
jgi:hypothetical protein|tara:strand:- start:635 stop:1501 length:867 start_codon:yes stop_codon:yes gene_type:complete